MKIVIDVDTDNPIHHAEGTDYFIPDLHAFISENLFKILKESCKVLPKGHGRLIDADAIVRKAYEEAQGMTNNNFGVEVNWLVDKSPTIIEADGGSK